MLSDAFEFILTNVLASNAAPLAGELILTVGVVISPGATLYTVT